MVAGGAQTNNVVVIDASKDMVCVIQNLNKKINGL